MTPLRLEAPAKLNLRLVVTGRRPDGFHTLATEMVLLELADHLLLMPGCSGLRVEGAGDGVPLAPDRNLAWRGLEAGLGGPVEMACLTLEKRIPAAAGLGGGSSDAAAAWRLGRRWRAAEEAADAATLERLAEIGADVPFFAARLPAALVEGVGERVTPSAATEGPDALLIHPPFSLSTAAVFAELRGGEWSGSQAPERANDLLAPATRLRPELADIFRLVADAGGLPQLTGSGPTVFCLTDDPERASGIAARLRRVGLRTSVTRLRREPASIEAFDDEAEES